MSALRAFPLRTAPRPDQALDSWLEATAVRLRVTMAELYEAPSRRPRPAGNASPASTPALRPLGMGARFLVVRMTRAR